MASNDLALLRDAAAALEDLGACTDPNCPDEACLRILPRLRVRLDAGISPVRVGQVWADNDKRAGGRNVRVLEIDSTHATVEQVAYNERDRIAAALPGARQTRIRLDRFRPTSTGYRLVQEES